MQSARKYLFQKHPSPPPLQRLNGTPKANRISEELRRESMSKKNIHVLFLKLFLNKTECHTDVLLLQ